MDTEKLVQDLGERITRREFLKRLGVGSLAALVGLIVSPDTASAGNWHCCDLCRTSAVQSFPYCNGVNNQTQKTKWCWVCWEGTTEYECCEYMAIGTPCADPTCLQVFGSYGHRYGGPVPEP